MQVPHVTVLVCEQWPCDKSLHNWLAWPCKVQPPGSASTPHPPLHVYPIPSTLRRTCGLWVAFCHVIFTPFPMRSTRSRCSLHAPPSFPLSAPPCHTPQLRHGLWVTFCHVIITSFPSAFPCSTPAPLLAAPNHPTLQHRRGLWVALCHVIITSFHMLYWLKDTELVVRPATVICMVLFGMQCFVS